MELELDGIADKSIEEQRKVKRKTLTHIEEILMAYRHGTHSSDGQTYNNKSTSLSDGSRAGDTTNQDKKLVEDGTIWRPSGQPYHVKGWGWGDETSSGTLNCMWKHQRQGQGRVDEEADGDEDEHLICIVRGNEWEPMPYPVTIDSVASASAFPKQWSQHVIVFETEGSRAGQTFDAANGQEIPNLGRFQMLFQI